LHLTEAELETVREAINHDLRPEIRQRATAIHLLHWNYKPAEVAEMMDVTPATIYNWGQRWQRNGIKGLANRAKSDCPSNADARYIALLEQTLDV
jgi:transposase